MAQQDSTDIFADGVDKTACGSCGSVIDTAGKAPLSIIQCPRCNHKMAVPGTFGPYQIFKCLGKGGSGATYRGMEKFLNRPVAIKVLRSSVGQNEQAIENFFREARILASLNHPNVAHVYSLGVEKGQPYIVMELVAGGRMDRLFGKDKPLDEKRAMDIAIDVAEGLIATHDKDLVHGDVKPSNILLDESGTAKLVDFGIVRVAGEAATEELAGTPYYIAPEQAQNLKIDFRADIYSLGATLFHALAGRPPFEGTTAKEVVKARLEKPVPNLADIRQDLTPQTCATVAKMMAVDPANRYASYRDLLSDLADALKAAGKRDLERQLAPAIGQESSPTMRPKPAAPSAPTRPAPVKIPSRTPQAAKTTHMRPVQLKQPLSPEKLVPWIIAAGILLIIGVVALVISLAK